MSWDDLKTDTRCAAGDDYLAGAPLDVYVAQYDITEETLRRRLREWISYLSEFISTLDAATRLDYFQSFDVYPTLKKRLVEQDIQDDDEATVATKLLDMVEQRMAGRTFDSSALPQFPQPSSIKEDYIVAEGDMILISDVEIPDFDPEMLRLAVALGKRHNIKTLGILGDFTAQDAFSMWAIVDKEERSEAYISEFETAIKIVMEMFTWFDNVYIVQGNHDIRVNRATNGEIMVRWLLGLGFRNAEKQPQVSKYNYMYLLTNQGPWLLQHPWKGSSRKPGALPEKIWMAERLPDELIASCGRVKPHIVGTHTHLATQTVTRDSMCQILEIGCVRDRTRTFYKQNKSSHAEWVNALGMIRNGYGRTFIKEFTDWRYELGESLFMYVFG